VVVFDLVNWQAHYYLKIPHLKAAPPIPQADTMTNVLILFATTEGQTARIAGRIAQTLRNRGHAVETRQADELREGFEPAKYDGVIVGASIHYGHHPAYLHSLVKQHKEALATRPGAFFSVSLSGGGPGAKPKAARRYLDVFLRQVGWHPEQTATFGGALQFSKYGAFKRMLMVMIVGFAGGDTDTARDYEYTDWAAVEGFAATFAERLEAP
jgi:menaquinone-dependent protoporphyrinogen oxidase